MMASRVSAVVPVRNEAANLPRTIQHLEASLPPRSEIIVVDDGSTDGGTDFLAGRPRIRLVRTTGLGVAGARNCGASRAVGDLLLFADGHVDAPPGGWEPLLAEASEHRVGAVAPAVSALGNPEARGYGMRLTGPALGVEWLGRAADDPYPVPVLCGCCLAMRRDTFEAIGGFDPGMIHWGSEDLELSIRLWLLGYEVRLVPEVNVGHLFRSSHPYAVAGTPVLHNLLRIALVHFGEARIGGVVEALKADPSFAAALALLLDGDVCKQRSRLADRRVHDDDWYVERFALPL